MALHGALASAAPGANAAAASRVGLLASVRDVRLHVLRLDDIESDLICEVTHLAGDNFTAMYEFALRDQDKSLLGGRASVVLDAGRRLTPMNEITTRALVTGGSGGIGASICRALGAQGHFVYVHAHRGVAAAESIAAGIVGAGGRARALQFDLTDAAAARAAIDRILEEGPIQVLVNNAGVHDDAVFPGMSPQQWHRVIDLSRSMDFITSLNL